MRTFPASNFGKGVALAVIAALLFGVHPIIAKLVYQYGGDVYGLNIVRVTIIYAGLALLLLLRRQPLLPTGRQFRDAWPLGISLFVLVTMHMAAVSMMDIALVTVIVFTYPFIIALLTYRYNRQEFSPVLLLALLLGFAGVILVIGPAPERMNSWGSLFAFIAACAIAWNLFRSGQLLKQYGTVVLAAHSVLLALPLIIVLGLVMGAHWPQSQAGWWWLVVFGCVCLAGQVAMFTAIKLIGAARFSIIIKLEPLITLLSAWLVFDERLEIIQMLGAAFLLSAIFLIDRKPEKAA